jgi:CheY-like chemotaxis protein
MEGDWVPGVMVTGTPLDRHRERARKAGFAAILPKPVDLDVLSALVRKLAAERWSR